MVLPYFAYGTTQNGFTHHRRLGLGEPVARVRTVQPHAVIVPRRAACSNPGCEYVHRMAALVAGLGGRVEGDLFELGEDAAASVDALETGPGSPYVRGEVEVAPVGGGPGVRARAYLASPTAGGCWWRAARPTRSRPTRASRRTRARSRTAACASPATRRPTT